MKNIFLYTIDNNNIIVNYSKNFSLFARENDWTSNIEPEKVIGHSFFEFISGPEAKQIYEILFQHCRNNKKYIGPIPFRCDSPTERRFSELYLRPLEDGHIDIINKIIKTEKRPSVDLLKSNIQRSDKIITICSMCKKIAISKNEWLEVEEALERLRIFEEEKYPKLSHGLCDRCFTIVLDSIENRKVKI